MSSTEIIAWSALGGGLLLGSLGTIVPGLPGAVFVAAGALVHKWLLPEILSWWGVGIVIALAIVSWLTDIAGTMLGARWGGATRAGLIGAAIGGLFGLFLGIPGLIFGPFLGAVIGDLIANRRDAVRLLKSGGGAAAGFLISLVVRIALLGVMVLTIGIDLFV